MQLADSLNLARHPSRRERRRRRAGLRELPPPRHVAARGAPRGGRERRRRLREARHRAGRASDDRVRLGQPDWAAARRQRLVRFLRRRARAALRAHGARGHPRVLRERHGRPSAALRREHPGPQARPARPRRRLSRSVRRRPRRAVRRTRRRCRGRPVGRRACARRHPHDARVDQHPLRRVVQPSVDRGERRGRGDDRSAAGQGADLRPRRCDLAAHRRLRRPAQGAGAASSRTATSPISVATSRTTATSSWSVATTA